MDIGVRREQRRSFRRGRRGSTSGSSSSGPVRFPAMAIRRAWSRLGTLPALPLVVLFFALAAAATLLGDDTATTAIGVALVAALIAYCVARPAGGTDLFLAVAAPNAGWQLAKDLLGAPAWVFYALLPIALIGAWVADHEDDPEDEDDVPVGVGHPDAEPPAARP
jgi:hypothetical protein